MQDIWESLHFTRSRINRFLATSSKDLGHHNFTKLHHFDHHGRLLHATHLSSSSWVSSDTRHRRFEASSTLARLQGLLNVSPSKLLAAVLGDLGVSTLHSIKTMTQFSSLFEHQTIHVDCFNAHGLLYECVFDALLCSSSYRPVGKPISHHVVTQPTFSSSSFWIIIPVILPATMLGYYSISASLMPSEFFHRRFDLLEVCFL
jgi:hypothetical protein